MSKKILVLHGPNLHLLGQREPNIYGTISLSEINKKMKAKAKKLGFELVAYQSNLEGEIIDKITKTKYDILIINPAGYTHTSIAIRDAIAAINQPSIEVHISNIYQREDFRKKSLIADVATGYIGGFGQNSYYLAIDAAAAILRPKNEKKN